ncbi:MAG TPA: VUT family protein [Pseudonocardiaceae bacterium]|jgi:hypothetical protein|nr:VUT family protein [Pseudonocardiaceae bacterium]
MIPDPAGPTRPRAAILVAALYLAGIVAANWVTSRYGLTHVGLGLLAPAGTWFAGGVIALRNTLQDAAGRRWVLACILAGALLSWATGSGRIALASGTTFLVSESLDMAVYSRLRTQRRWRVAVIAGTWTGAVIDTLMFLGLSGLGITGPAVAGQLLVKAIWVTGTYLLLRETIQRATGTRTGAVAA